MVSEKDPEHIPEVIKPKIQVRTALDYLAEKANKLGMPNTSAAIEKAIEVANVEISAKDSI